MENLLFIRLRLLGDIIFTIPSIQMYKKRFPQNKIFYVVEEKFKEIAGIIPGIHEVIVIPHKMSIKDIIKFRRNIKKIGINTVIDFHSGPKSALLTFVTGAKTRIGYKTPNRNWAYNHLTPRKINDTYSHSVYNQARLLEHTGIKINKVPYYPEITINKEKISKSVIEATEKNKKVVIHIGAKKKFRDWGINNFLALIKRLGEKKFNTSIIGNSEEEKQRGNYLKNHCYVNNFTGKLSISETLFLISNSDVYFGVDSGPLHLASLTKTPIVAIYGPNIPEISGPWREKKNKIIQADLDCIPCSQKRCIYDTIRCMKNIKMDVVYEAIFEYIK